MISCFFCDHLLEWSTAFISPFGKAFCAECAEVVTR